MFLAEFVHTNAILEPREPPSFGKSDILYISPLMELKQVQGFIDHLPWGDRERVMSLAVKNSLWDDEEFDITKTLTVFTNLKNLILVVVEEGEGGLGPLGIDSEPVKFISILPRDVFREDRAQMALAKAFTWTGRDDTTILVDVMRLQRGGQLFPSGETYVSGCTIVNQGHDIVTWDDNSDIAEALSKINLEVPDEVEDAGISDILDAALEEETSQVKDCGH